MGYGVRDAGYFGGFEDAEGKVSSLSIDVPAKLPSCFRIGHAAPVTEALGCGHACVLIIALTGI